MKLHERNIYRVMILLLLLTILGQLFYVKDSTFPLNGQFKLENGSYNNNLYVFNHSGTFVNYIDGKTISSGTFRELDNKIYQLSNGKLVVYLDDYLKFIVYDGNNFTVENIYFQNSKYVVVY